MSKFNIGDRVIIINYGTLVSKAKSDPNCGKLSLKIYKETDRVIIYDKDSELLGKRGIVDSIENGKYHLVGPFKTGPYNEEQLKKV